MQRKPTCFGSSSPIYTATAEAREIFCGDRSGQRVPEEGEIIRQPELADTIERLAVEGEHVFYRGEMARAIVAQCQQEGGQLTREDLESYDVIKRKPLGGRIPWLARDHQSTYRHPAAS